MPVLSSLTTWEGEKNRVQISFLKLSKLKESCIDIFYLPKFVL